MITLEEMNEKKLIKTLIKKLNSNENVKDIEGEISKNIELYVSQPEFFDIPVKSMIRILEQKGEISFDVCRIILSNAKEPRRILPYCFLSAADTEFEDVVTLLCMVKDIPICQILKSKFKGFEDNDCLFKNEIIIKPEKLEPNIHEACKNGDIASVKYLLYMDKSKLEKKNENGWTPLHFAVCCDKQDIVKVLLQCGADINTQTKVPFLEYIFLLWFLLCSL